MKTIHTTQRALPAILCTLALSALAAPPDAGSVLRDELRREPTPGQAPAATAGPQIGGKIASDEGPKTQVNGYRVVGLSALPAGEAQAFLAAYAGAPLSVEALHRVAEKFEQWLRSRGLFTARAYIPPQDLKDAVVEIRVLEGRLEGIDIKRAPGSRLKEDKLRAMLAGALPPGSALQQERLERGLLLLNDLPVTSARAVLVPGQELGGSRVVVEAAQGPLYSGNAELDNTGNRYTGELRVGASLNVNDYFGLGDQWSLRASTSQGSSFVRGGYSIPVGADGWKVGAALMESRYTLCCSDAVNALDANGDASVLSAYVSYPWIRSRNRNLSASANWASRGFVNHSLGATTSDKKSNALSLGVNGDRSDAEGPLGLGAYTTYAAQWMTGRVNLDGLAADRTQDAATAGTQGGFDKLTGQANVLMRLNKNATVYASLAVQWAGKNLDSSEKFVLGGLQGVRAYPSGEGSGDEGWLLNLEWRRDIDAKWGVVAFFDHGEITQHHSTWANWNAATPNQGNSYGLTGTGVSVIWSPAPGRQITSTLATRLGSNPARDAAGHDSDGRGARPQLWITGNLAF